MHIKKITNNTYFIEAETNIGLYTENNEDYILIDTCYPGESSEKLIKFLRSNNINVIGIINTHSHIDHVGANSLIQESFACKIAAPAIENIFIEHPDISGMYLYPTAPFKNIASSRHTSCKVDTIIDSNENELEFCKHKFNIISLKGHSPNHIGVITPDNVVFTGDAFLGIDILKNLKLPFSYDLIEDRKSKKFLLSTDYDYYVPSHGTLIKDITNTIKANIKYIDDIANNILCILKAPLGLDEIMGKVIVESNISPNTVPYLISQTCICGFLSYLENTKRVSIVFQNGILKYVAS